MTAKSAIVNCNNMTRQQVKYYNYGPDVVALKTIHICQIHVHSHPIKHKNALKLQTNMYIKKINHKDLKT